MFLGMINSVVHAVMYCYYFITNYNPEYKKKIWWKKYITQMQMVSKRKVNLNIDILRFHKIKF